MANKKENAFIDPEEVLKMSKLQAPQGLEDSARRFTAGISPSRRRAMSQSFSSSFYVRLEKMNGENKRREFRSYHSKKLLSPFSAPLRRKPFGFSQVQKEPSIPQHRNTPTPQYSNTPILLTPDQLSKVNPTFTVTCQCSTLLSTIWPRTSATSNQPMLRIVLPARSIAFFTASSMPLGEEPTSSIFL